MEGLVLLGIAVATFVFYRDQMRRAHQRARSFPRTGSPAWHRQMTRMSREPERALRDGWGFELGMLLPIYGFLTGVFLVLWLTMPELFAAIAWWEWGGVLMAYTLLNGALCWGRRAGLCAFYQMHGPAYLRYRAWKQQQKECE